MEFKEARGVTVKEVIVSEAEVREAIETKLAKDFMKKDYHVYSTNIERRNGLGVKALVTVSTIVSERELEKEEEASPKISAKFKKTKTDNERF